MTMDPWLNDEYYVDGITVHDMTNIRSMKMPEGMVVVNINNHGGKLSILAESKEKDMILIAFPSDQEISLEFPREESVEENWTRHYGGSGGEVLLSELELNYQGSIGTCPKCNGTGMA